MQVDLRKLGGGADNRSRTYDLRITNALLYQLSYIGFGSLTSECRPECVEQLMQKRPVSQ